MVFGEIIPFLAFKAKHADHFAFERQRHDEFGKCLAVNVQVAGIFCNVADTKRFVRLRGRSNEPGSQGQGELAMFLLVGADDELGLQQAVAFVEEKDRENVIVDLRFNAGGDLFTSSSISRVEPMSRLISYSSSKSSRLFRSLS